MPKKGLPTDLRMRADAHFVDHITSGRTNAVGRMIEISRIDPNPKQPRREMIGLDELIASVRERGVLEPILLRPLETGRFEIIAGERRFQAAKAAGLTMIPAVELEVDDRGSLEISLVENLQRRDLTPFEEADAIQRLQDEFRYTHEQIAKKLGRSRVSVTEILSLGRLPNTVRAACRRADITTKSTLMQIVRQPDEPSMLALIEAIERGDLSRDDVRERRKMGVPIEADPGLPPERVRPFVFKYRPANRDFTLSLKFERDNVDPRELVQALEGIISDLRGEIGRDDFEGFHNFSSKPGKTKPEAEDH